MNTQKPLAITCKGLYKDYTAFHKSSGLKASLKSLFYRKKDIIHALKPTDLTIKEGEFVGLLGPNGAGKTTLIKTLTGVMHPTGGEAKVLDYTPWKRNHDLLRQITLVMGQKSQLWWDLPPMDTFLLHKHIYEIEESTYNKTLSDLISMLGVEDVVTIPTRKLSLGQRMKCELIAALIHRPRVVFLDEPTIGLDVISQKSIRDFLREYNQKTGATVLLTSHYMEDIKELCERVIIINFGKLVIDTTYEELIDQYQTNVDIEVTFKDLPKRESLNEFGSVIAYNVNTNMVRFSIERNKKAEVIRELFKRYDISNFSLKEQEASEVIREVFGEIE